MFNLLVRGSEWDEQQAVVYRERIFEYTKDSLIQQFGPGSDLKVDEVRKLPTLFMQEGGDEDQLARIGQIRSIEPIDSKRLLIEFTFDEKAPSIPNSVLYNAANELDIDSFEFSRTHWAVKPGDIYRFALHRAPRHRPQPIMFRLREPEVVDRKKIAVMMPFDAAYSKVYSAIRTAAVGLDLQCHRADDIWVHDHIIQDIVTLIDESHIVVCDCTGRNPNVFYEIGIAHTLGRRVVLITQVKDDIPFDLRPLRFIHYYGNAQGLRDLSDALKARLADLIALVPAHD